MKIDDKVTIVIKTPVATTEESGIISDITDEHIFIEGLKVPFDRKTGIKTEGFSGTKVYIKEIG